MGEVLTEKIAIQGIIAKLFIVVFHCFTSRHVCDLFALVLRQDASKLDASVVPSPGPRQAALRCRADIAAAFCGLSQALGITQPVT